MAKPHLLLTLRPTQAEGFVGWFETSAKADVNIDAAARFLVKAILGHETIFSARQLERDRLGETARLGERKAAGGGCC